MKTLPKVSIGIPTWNRSGYLVQALESVLAQTYTHVEVIVSDNASDDDTQEQLRRFKDPRVRAFRQDTNIGGIANLNFCLQQASGELFLLLCDDDVLAPTAIEKLSRPFREGKDGVDSSCIGLSWCICVNVDPGGRPLWAVRSGPAIESPVSLLEGLCNGIRGPQFSGVMIRTADARMAGGYNAARYGLACDSSNWGLASLKYANVACIDERLMFYRVHNATQINETTSASIDAWHRWIENEIEDFIPLAREHHGDAAAGKLLKSKNNLLANITVTVLMRYIGQPGWKRHFAGEFWRFRDFMLTPYVAKRIIKDGWKLLRL